MGWEYRAGGGPYYVRKTKQQGREVREYFGRGPAAERAAAEDARKRAVHERERVEWQQLEVLDADLMQLDQLVTLLTDSTFVTHGYYRHHGDPLWRKRKG
jgi:hypothetical protein